MRILVMKRRRMAMLWYTIQWTRNHLKRHYSRFMDKLGPDGVLFSLLCCLPSVVSDTEYEQDVDENSQGGSNHDQDDFNTEKCPGGL